MTLLEDVDAHEWWKFAVDDDKRQADLEAVKTQYDEAVNVISRRFEDRVEKLERGDELPPGVLEDGQGVRRGEAQAAAGRQDGRPSRQQGRHQPHPADRGHAVPRRRHACRHRAQPAGRAVAHERRADLRDASRLGLARPRPADRRRCSKTWRERDKDIAPARTPKALRDQAQGRLRRRLCQGASTAADDDELVELASEPDRGRADGARRCSTARAKRRVGDAGAGRPRHVGPGRRCSTAAPASRSTAR